MFDPSLEQIQNLTQLATMFDIRKEEGYDDRDRVDEYLALPEVRRPGACFCGSHHNSRWPLSRLVLCSVGAGAALHR